MEQLTSNAAQVIISIIPIVGIVMGAAVVILYLLLNHKHKTLLIQAGQWKPADFDLRTFSLLTGLLLTSVGIALTIFLATAIGTSYGLLGGLIPLSIGTGLLVYYGIKCSERGK